MRDALNKNRFKLINCNPPMGILSLLLAVVVDRKFRFFRFDLSEIFTGKGILEKKKMLPILPLVEIYIYTRYISRDK